MVVTTCADNSKPERATMEKVKLSDLKDHLSEFIKMANEVDIVVTCHGRPAAVLIGFETEEDWLEYCAQRDPHLQGRIDAARARSLEKWRAVGEATPASKAVEHRHESDVAKEVSQDVSPPSA